MAKIIKRIIIAILIILNIILLCFNFLLVELNSHDYESNLTGGLYFDDLTVWSFNGIFEELQGNQTGKIVLMALDIVEFRNKTAVQEQTLSEKGIMVSFDKLKIMPKNIGEIEQVKNKINVNKTYTISPQYDSTTRLISEIKIETVWE